VMIINTYDQLKAARDAGFATRRTVALSYSAPDRSNSRDVSVPKWSVFSPFFQTNPEAAWYDNGCKTFLLGLKGATHKERKEAALKEAMAWATQRYLISEWAKNRQGDYVDKEINDNFPLAKRTRDGGKFDG
jgi:hypothetical protein